MNSPTYFLEKNEIDHKYHVVDETGGALGNGDSPASAIAHARVVTNKPIYIGHNVLPGYCVTTPKEELIYNADEFINELAELAGMRVQKNYDDNLFFIGYSMELIE